MDISQVLSIGGSFAGAILGVWLGRYLQRHNETVKWRRNRLLDAYSEFLRAMDSAVGAGNAACANGAPMKSVHWREPNNHRTSAGRPAVILASCGA
jgi:hypothetical protein